MKGSIKLDILAVDEDNKPYNIEIQRSDKGQKPKLFNDGEHIIYVNGSYQDETTDIGKLMHDFFCEKS